MKKRVFFKSALLISALLMPIQSTFALPPPTGSTPTQSYTPSQGSLPSQSAFPAQGTPGQATSPSPSTKPSPTSTAPSKSSPTAVPKKVEKQIKSSDSLGKGGGATLFTAPGIIAVKETGWVGSDNLYNLTDRIGVSVEILKPASLALNITEETLKNIVAEVMLKANLRPEINPALSSAPLPFFHVLVMLYPHEGTLAIFCEGRLFESVKIDRVIIDRSTLLQAITWEKQSLVIVPLFDANAQVGRAVADLTKVFVDRFIYFEHIKTQNKGA